MNPKSVTKYQCPTCCERHDKEYQAEDCCKPEAEEVTMWACAECGDAHDDREHAHLCCWDEASDLEPLLPTPQELEAAGQQRLPL